MSILRLSIIFVLFLSGAVLLEARPSLRGPGGMINIPTAYLSTGGSVAPRNLDNGSSDAVTSLNYAWDKTAEFAFQTADQLESSVSVKYQFSQDAVKNNEDSPATAIGFLDMASENRKAFYGVMSKKAPEAPFVLHAGIISEGSILGNVKLFGGFETPISKQFIFMSEFDGLRSDINSGFSYMVSKNVGSFVYMMDVAKYGLQAEKVTGFTFNVAF